MHALPSNLEARTARQEIRKGSEDWAERDGMLFFKHWLYIPNLAHVRLALLQEAHEAPSAAHLGITRMYDSVAALYYWKGLREDVHNFVTTCDVCQRVKAPRTKPGGLLQPLKPPLRPWEQISLDFIVGLPATPEGWNAVLVFVDRFSRMVHLAATKDTCTAEQAADLLLKHVYRLHGMPGSILSDHDPRFTSRFWQALHKGLGTKLLMSTAFHPQTDGSTKRSNQTIEDMLRSYVSTHQIRWENISIWWNLHSTMLATARRGYLCSFCAARSLKRC